MMCGNNERVVKIIYFIIKLPSKAITLTINQFSITFFIGLNAFIVKE